MVKVIFTVIGIAVAIAVAVLFINPAWSGSQDGAVNAPPQEIIYTSKPVIQELPPSPPPVRTRPARTQAGTTMPIPVDAVLESGVLIVISKASQEMYVFENGELWGTSPVSTGKRGKETPSGIFPILQKRRHHRSNIYSNAPMPFMQRMTWGGIAIHEGRLPGYPASHGCIRLPREFARSLFRLTDRDTTTVVVTDYALDTSGQARLLALNMPMPQPGRSGHLIQGDEPRLAQWTTEPEEQTTAVAAASRPRPQNLLPEPAPARARPTGRSQTIQLAAAGSMAEAEAYWSRVRRQHPELAQYEKQIIPATVNARRVYRLRVTGPGARASCTSLKQSGTDCFPVS